MVTLIVLAFIVYFGYSVLDRTGVIKKDSSSETETTVYTLSEDEISKAWENYTAEEETTVAETTVAEDTSAEAETTASEVVDETVVTEDAVSE